MPEKNSTETPNFVEHDGNFNHLTSDKAVSKVSVVTVCLNARSTIEDTLRSVREQSFSSIEHVIIDGGSTDGTVEIIKSYCPDYFITEPDSGLYYAMQKGAHASTGDAIFFLNSGDTFFDSEVIADVVSFFNETDSDAVFGNLFPCYLNCDDTHDHIAFRDQRLIDFSYFNNRRLFYNESIHHQTIFYKRRIFENCGFICDNEDANGEYHLHMCAFVLHGYSAKHLPRLICRFALGGKSTSNFAQEWKRFVAARKILRERFFPSGPNIFVLDKNEYLRYPPSFKNQLKIFFRKTIWHYVLLQLKDVWRKISLN